MDFSKLLERIYQGFILRDFLGFISPGVLSLIFWGLVFLPDFTKAILIGNPSIWAALAFLTASFLWGWVMQSLLFGFINFVDLVQRSLKSIYEQPKNETKLSEPKSELKDSPLVTRLALEPDLAWANSAGKHLLEERLKDFPYYERLSALMLMSGNLATALLPPIIMIIGVENFSCAKWLLLLIPISLYWEFWRLWKARNLQMAIYTSRLRLW